VLLYKLQKEQEAMILDRASRIRQDGAAEDGLQAGPLPFSSPVRCLLFLLAALVALVDVLL
jgi:hypothetical protein